MLRLSITRRLISLSPSSESLVPSIFPFLSWRMLLPCLHGCHFVRHLGICNRIRVKLLQLMCAVITHKSAKNQLSVLTNGWVTSNYSVLQPPFCPPSWNLWMDVSIFYNWCPVSLRTIQWKNEVSILINGWVTAKYSVSRPPFCSPSWNL